jgi:hypothetical protein
MQSLLDDINRARLVSTPILTITTPDGPALRNAIISSIAAEDEKEAQEKAKELGKKAKVPFEVTTAIVTWDRSRGMYPCNEPAKKALQEMCAKIKLAPEVLEKASAEPQNAMRFAYHLPANTIVIAMNFDRFFREGLMGDTIQAVSNTRDVYKENRRTLILTAPSFDLPAELRQDVISLEDPLPDDEGYSSIIHNLYEAADRGKPSKHIIEKATLAVRGLSAFESEQVLAMSMAVDLDKGVSEAEIDIASAWEHKKRAVSKVKGLKLSLDGPALENLRGQDAIIAMLDRHFNGPMAARAVVTVDELDKAMAGLGSKGGPGDNTGISQDSLQQFLSNMEDNGWTGAILVGVRGSGKTALTESVAKHYGVPRISMDTGAMKAKHVGESEQAIRDAFRTIKSIGGSRVMVLATCNKLEVLPPELLRRFKLNIWYFDLLTPGERDALWPIYLKKYGLDPKSKRPDDTDWTGSEIRNCCENAYALNLPIEEVAEKYIIPIRVSDPKSIDDMRAMAEGKFLSASHGGKYQQEFFEAHKGPQQRRLGKNAN